MVIEMQRGRRPKLRAKVFGQLRPGPGTKRFFEHVSVLNSQAVLRNDVTLYAR